MKHESHDGAEDPRHPVLGGPLRVRNALVFTVADRRAAMLAGEAFFDGGPAPANPYTEVLKYVESLGDRASLTAYEEEDDEKDTGGRWRDGRLEFAVPAEHAPPRAFSGTHYLQVDDPADRLAVEKILGSRGGDTRRCYRPVIQYPLDFVAPAGMEVAPAPAAPGGTLPLQWALEKCGFPKVWATLEPGNAPVPVAVIDQGVDYGHRELAGVVRTREVTRRSSTASRSIHAGAVMGVLSSRRDDADISGCCSAPIDLYNVWTSDQGFDSAAFYGALRDVARSGARVLNLSLGSTESDPLVHRLISRCIAKGVVVVAAMGNKGGPRDKPIYPAAYRGVIAVGATTPSDRRPAWSSTGRHIHVSAPGEGIRTLRAVDEFDNLHGTSFATPMVAAAVWLMLNARPCWRPRQVREVLAAAAARAGGPRFDEELGHGRLDMVRVLEEIRRRPCGHPEHAAV